MKNQLNPLLARQFISGVRRSRFFWLLSFHVLLQGLVAFGFLRLGGMVTSTGEDARISLAGLLNNARQLYWLSSLLLLLTGGLLAPIAAIGGLAGEMEHRTFDLLRITTLSPQALVLGKWGTAILTGLLLLLTPIPVQLLGFWLGGVTLIELLLTQVFLFVILMLNTALALAISARVHKTWIAVLSFYGLILMAAPLLGGSALLIILYNGWNIPVSSTQPLWQMALAQHGWVLLTGVHPLSAAIASVILGTEQGAWFWLTFPIMGAGGTPTISLPAPWLTHTLLALPTTAALLWWTARRLARPEV